MTHDRPPGLAARWPAILVSVVVLAATAYSFSPRQAPQFPATQVRADGLHVNHLARSGDTLIAVGELGRILVAEQAEGPWREAQMQPQRGSTLTTVHVLGNGRVLAGGHDGWILLSEDHGRTWREAAFEEELTEPVLAFAGPFDSALYAVGGFGLYRRSDDGGRSWQNLRIEEARDPTLPAPETKAADPNDLYAIPDEGFADRHLSGLVRMDDGGMILVGESGVIARSDDQGATWRRLPDVYAGSFFGALKLPRNTVLVYGMRGHVFRSTDGGRCWTRSRVPGEASLFGAARLDSGEILLVGAGNTVLRSRDEGASFERISAPQRSTLAHVLPLDAQRWLTAGDAGVQLQSAVQATGAAS